MALLGWILVTVTALMGTGYFVYPHISVMEIEKFLNDMTEQGSEMVAAEMDGRQLDEFHGKADLYLVDMTYSVTGMNITHYVPPVTLVLVHPGNVSATWSLLDADIYISGNFGLGLDGESPDSTHTQAFNLTISGISLLFNIAFGINRLLLPTVKLPVCFCEVSAIEVEVEGWLFNQIVPSVEEAIQTQISDQICTSIHSSIWYIGMAVSSIIAMIVSLSVWCIRRARRPKPTVVTNHTRDDRDSPPVGDKDSTDSGSNEPELDPGTTQTTEEKSADDQSESTSEEKSAEQTGETLREPTDTQEVVQENNSVQTQDSNVQEMPKDTSDTQKQGLDETFLHRDVEETDVMSNNSSTEVSIADCKPLEEPTLNEPSDISKS